MKYKLSGKNKMNQIQLLIIFVTRNALGRLTYHRTPSSKTILYNTMMASSV